MSWLLVRDSELRLHSLHSPMYTDDCWGRTGPGSVVTLTETSKPKRLACVDEIKRAARSRRTVPFQYLVQHLASAAKNMTRANSTRPSRRSRT